MIIMLDIFPSFLIFIRLSCSILFVACGVENSVGPDKLDSQKPADLDLQCFQKKYVKVHHIQYFGNSLLGGHLKTRNWTTEFIKFFIWIVFGYMAVMYSDIGFRHLQFGK